MARGKRRAILWGTMVLPGGKRRRYLFRLDPQGLLAIRIGNPLSWTAFGLTSLGLYLLLRGTLGIASLAAGAAAGMAILGVLDGTIARALARQPQEQLLRSPMNLLLPREVCRGGRVKAAGRWTRVAVPWEGGEIGIAITRPPPPGAMETLKALWEA